MLTVDQVNRKIKSKVEGHLKKMYVCMCMFKKYLAQEISLVFQELADTP